MRKSRFTEEQIVGILREAESGVDFIALVAEVLHPETPFQCIVTHLDVHGGPSDRAQQMRELLAAVAPGRAVLAGDLNTTTFSRGGLHRGVATLGTLACAPRAELQARLNAPHAPIGRAREPLFDLLRVASFALEPFNANAPSLDLRFDDLHELDVLRGPLRDVALRSLRRIERRVVRRLDWIAARGFEPDAALPPFVLPELARGARAASDHAPIGCALRSPRTRSRPGRPNRRG